MLVNGVIIKNKHILLFRVTNEDFAYFFLI